MTFKTEVIGCYWQQETGEWLVKLKQTNSDGTSRLFEDRCHMLLHGTGILNNFKWPAIEGMENFKGKIMHTAQWPKDYQAEEWKKDRVAVIGSGVSIPCFAILSMSLTVMSRLPVFKQCLICSHMRSISMSS